MMMLVGEFTLGMTFQSYIALAHKIGDWQGSKMELVSI
jgi:hypothetical protein